jgi:hypothetical protein
MIRKHFYLPQYLLILLICYVFIYQNNYLTLPYSTSSVFIFCDSTQQVHYLMKPHENHENFQITPDCERMNYKSVADGIFAWLWNAFLNMIKYISNMFLVSNINKYWAKNWCMDRKTEEHVGKIVTALGIGLHSIYRPDAF